MAEGAQDGRRERAELQHIAGQQRRGRRAVLRACAMVAGAEDDGGEVAHVIDGQRAAAGEAHLDGRSGAVMDSVQARRECGRIVGHHEVARIEIVGQSRPRRVFEATIGRDDQ